MPDQLQLRGGTTTEHNSFTGALREVTVDTTKKTLVVHDGASAGGTALMRESGGNAASSVQIGSGGVNAFTIDSNQDITLTGASANVVWDKSNNAFEFADNAKATFGTGGDLEIFHNGTDSILINSTGQLSLRANNLHLTAKNTENYLVGTANGAVELYYDNSKKFQTESSGATIFGNLAVDQINLGDDDQIRMGANNDFILFHNSSVGNIMQHGFQPFFIKSSNGKTQIKTVVSGTVELYYDGTKKFETRSDGLQVDGTVRLPADNSKLLFGAGLDLEIFHDSANNNIKGTGNHIMRFWTNNTIRWNILNDGHFRPEANNSYDIGASNQRVRTVFASNALDMADNAKVQLGDSDDLQIYHDGGDNHIDSPSNAHKLKIQAEANIELRRAGANEVMAAFSPNGAVELYYDNSKKLNTHPNGIFTQGIYPMSDNTYDIGSGSERFDDIFATNGTIQTSDENAKKDIVTSDLGLTFINAVKPVSYKFKTGTRTHYGIIAQDLETVLDGKDFAGLIKDTETNNYGIRYTELIAPLIKAVQELSAKVAVLEAA